MSIGAWREPGALQLRGYGIGGDGSSCLHHKAPREVMTVSSVTTSCIVLRDASGDDHPPRFRLVGRFALVTGVFLPRVCVAPGCLASATLRTCRASDAPPAEGA